MQSSGKTLRRQWEILKRLPRYPRRITTRAIKDALADEGVEVNIRTIQRDLGHLSCSFPISEKTEGRTNYWCWTDMDRVLEIPTMSPSAALAFHLARPHLEPQLPPAVLDVLMPYFARATEVLGGTGLEKWAERILTIGSGPKLTPAEVHPEVQEVVYQALLDEQRFEVEYHSREKGGVSHYVVSPLGMVIRKGVFYLVCTLWDYEDIRHLALHRISGATLLEEPVSRPEGFDLLAYVEGDKAFAYPASPKQIRLRALFDADAAYHLRERTLSADQRLTEQKDGRVLLTAIVADTQELRWWLLGFGAGVEVVGPKALREEMATTLLYAAKAYG